MENKPNLFAEWKEKNKGKKFHDKDPKEWVEIINQYIRDKKTVIDFRVDHEINRSTWYNVVRPAVREIEGFKEFPSKRKKIEGDYQIIQYEEPTPKYEEEKPIQMKPEPEKAKSKLFMCYSEDSEQILQIMKGILHG